MGLLMQKPPHTMELLAANSNATVAMLMSYCRDTVQLMMKRLDHTQELLERNPSSALRILTENAKDAMELLVEHDSTLAESVSVTAPEPSAKAAFHLLRQCEL